MSPKISVLTPTFNCARFIERCINSVLNQQHPNFEHIIVDGASSDNTVEILKQYPHIRWLSEPDRGEGEALNKALKMATGDLVVWLNSDDWLAPGAFNAVVAAYSSAPANTIIYGNTEFVDEQDRFVSLKRSATETNMQSLVRWWLNPEHPHQPSMYFPLSVMRSVGPFNDSLHFSIDYEYWLRCATRAIFKHVDAVLSFACLRQDCKSANTEVGQIQSHWQVLNPFLSALSHNEQVLFWAEYFINRLQYGNQNESTHFPDVAASVAGLSLVLQNSPNGESLLQLLFPDQQVRERVQALVNNAGAPHEFQAAQKPKPKIAGIDTPEGKNLTQIDKESDFARMIREVFSQISPRKIIETGTYLGNGTTRIIAEQLRNQGISDAKFFSIEVNPSHYNEAVHNLSQNGLIQLVTLLKGLSLPRSLLPSQDTIHAELVANLPNEDIFVDHAEQNRAQLYFNETGYGDGPDNLLEACLQAFDYQPDFVLLDSAGHIGHLEFNYLIEKLKGPCVIALDDIKHVKHFRSFKQMKEDPRFSIVHASDEKFGFCVAQFTPANSHATVIINESKGGTLLWVKTDSIGDAVLAADAIPRFAQWLGVRRTVVVCQDQVTEVYVNAPGVDLIVPFSKPRLQSDPSYQNELMSQIHQLEPTIAVNPTFSRDLVSDYVTLHSGAKITIAWDSPPHNLRPEDLKSANEIYTFLVSADSLPPTELEKNAEFLARLGVSTSPLEPVFLISDQDIAWAENTLSSFGFDPEKTVPVFFGAQHDIRHYRHYGEALKRLTTNHGFSYVGLGSPKCRNINQENLIQSGAPYVDLSGSTSLKQAAAMMKVCGRAAGSETGLAHIACAVGVPNIILVGGGHFGRFMPYSPLTTVACLPLECFGCNWHCSKTAPHCVRDLSSETFYIALELGLRNDFRSAPLIILQSKETWSAHHTGLPNWNQEVVTQYAPGCIQLDTNTALGMLTESVATSSTGPYSLRAGI